MSQKLYEVPAEWKRRAFIDAAKYRDMYARSIQDPDGFWGDIGKRIDWFKPYSKVKNSSFDLHRVSIKWYEDGVTNVAHNCIDRHLAKRGDQVAILWEGDDPKEDRRITYKELHTQVCKFANVLKAQGVNKGDRVTIYLPMIPELAFAMLACTRIGAIHSIVFGGFSPDSLAGRIKDCKSTIIVTADEGLRGGRKVPLKANADAAAEKAGGVQSMVVVRRTGGAVNMKPGRDHYYDELAKGATTLMFEGVPNYPTISRFWEVVDKHQVNIIYTAPTAIRALMQAGEAPVKKTSRKPQPPRATPGEPNNPAARDRQPGVVGRAAAPADDTWWQTE